MTLRSLWLSLRSALEGALADRDGAVWQRVDRLLTEIAGRLRDDPAVRSRIDAQVLDAIVWLVNNYGEQLTTVISVTIQRWDPQQASRRIELMVGRDLQFIRINGTVVGALVGLLLHVVVVFVPWG